MKLWKEATRCTVLSCRGVARRFRQLPLPLEIRQGLFGVEAAMKGEKKATESQAAGKACLKIADFVAYANARLWHTGAALRLCQLLCLSCDMQERYPRN